MLLIELECLDTNAEVNYFLVVWAELVIVAIFQAKHAYSTQNNDIPTNLRCGCKCSKIALSCNLSVREYDVERI